MRILIVLIFLFCRSSAVVYQLNDTQYVRMPPIFHLDSYELCIHQPGGLYCMVEVDLVADDSNELMDMIQEYSERKETHFNHTRLHHGICVTKMCNEYYIQNTTTNLKLVIEGCLNNTLWKDYKLKTRINEDVTCNDQDHKFELEPLDIAVAVICLSLMLMNIAGTIYDILIFKKKDHEGNKLLLCFSAKRNWLKLTAPATDGQEQGISRLEGLNGMRALTIFIIIMEHALVPFMVASDNTHFIEQIYNSIFHIMLEGAIFVQTFFIISGCLLAYHLQLISEKKDMTLKMIPKAIFLRWLRLTPPHAIVLAVSSTWLRFAGTGPLWHQIITSEVDSCRQRGWINLFYINNYFDNTYCMQHTWYLAADMQLYILGMFILVLAKSDRARKIVLSLMLAIGSVLPAFHTYFQNLNAYMIISPEASRVMYRNDPTFDNVYKRGHTNMVCYILGLGVGLLIYHLQKEQFDIGKYRKFKYIYWGIVPLFIGLLHCNGWFYMDDVTPSLYTKAIYSSLIKCVAGFLITVFILGMVFKIENIYRPIVEWPGWRSPAKVSYSAYLLHVMLIQIFTATRTTLIHITIPQVMLLWIGSGVISYMVAFLFWLVAESPFEQLLKLIKTAESDKKSN